MKIFIENDYEAMSRRAAEIISARIAAAPESVLGLATGSTPLGIYTELIRMYKAGAVDFSRVATFNLDEYFPISRGNEQSYFAYMKKNFFDFTNIPAENTFIPNGEAADISAECADYEAKIAARGGIDLQILGIGNNGHIGFNEPDEFFPAATHHIALDESTIKANARFFENEGNVPRHAITMGIGTIMRARKILLLASGAGKAAILREALHGKITPKNPASVLQLHGDVTVIADRDAGGDIGGFAPEPPRAF